VSLGCSKPVKSGDTYITHTHHLPANIIPTEKQAWKPRFKEDTSLGIGTAAIILSAISLFAQLFKKQAVRHMYIDNVNLLIADTQAAPMFLRIMTPAGADLPTKR
jgi:hypothetical protein